MMENEKSNPDAPDGAAAIEEAVGKQQYDEIVALLKSTRADFENYQKRLAKERENDRVVAVDGRTVRATVTAPVFFDPENTRRDG